MASARLRRGGSVDSSVHRRGAERVSAVGTRGRVEGDARSQRWRQLRVGTGTNPCASASASGHTLPGVARVDRDETGFT